MCAAHEEIDQIHEAEEAANKQLKEAEAHAKEIRESAEKEAKEEESTFCLLMSMQTRTSPIS